MIKDIRLNLSMTDMKKWCDEYFATESSDIYCSKRKLVKRSSSSKNGAKQSTMLYAFPKVFNQLETYLQKELPRYTFITSWINSNGYDSFNKPHWHSRTKNDDRISGIYYVSEPDKNMGNLYFETGEEYEPIENRLILFPSHLVHGVRKNLSQKKRVSIAFNYEIRNKSGITI